MAISSDQVRRIAELAALRLDDDEVERLRGELADILAHFEALAEVDERETAERSGPDLDDTGTRSQERKVTLRPDEPGADPLGHPPGGTAPEFRDGFFTVPRLASHADAPSPRPEESGGDEEPHVRPDGTAGSGASGGSGGDGS